MEGLGTVFLLGIGLFLFLMWTAGIIAIRPKYFFRIWIGVPALGLVLLIGFGAGIVYYQSLPSVVFRGAVGFEPTTDVTIVNSLRHMPIDWDDTYLEFYASDSTIDQILQHGFTTIIPSDIIIESYWLPEWWNPPTGSDIRVYATHADDPLFRNKDFGFSLSHKLLIYDPSSGTSDRRLVYLRYRRP